MTTPREEPSIYVHGLYDRPPTAAFEPVPPPTISAPPAIGSRRPWAIAIAAGAVAVVVLLGATAAVVWYLYPASRMTVNGAITLTGQTSLGAASGDSCSGRDGYDDINAGAEVTITDAGVTTVAITELGQGIEDSVGCTFRWTATDVPTGKKFYGVVVGRRPAIKLPEAQMHQLVALSLG